MKTYSVADVSVMFNVNAETIRRWIRDGKLKSKRAMGPGGSTMLLRDVVAFANTPPRAHLLPLELWLTENAIPFERIEDPKKFAHSERTKVLSSLATGSAASTIASATIPATLAAGPAGLAIGAVGIGVAGITYGATKAKRKLYQTYTIRLISSDDANQNTISSDAKNTETPKYLPTNPPIPSPIEKSTEAPTVADQEAKRSPSSENTGNFATLVSIMDEITKAKQLLDASIITKEEFTEIKSRLISKI